MTSLFLTSASAMVIFYSIILALDSAIYWAASNLYEVFVLICQTQLFTSSTFSSFSTRIYAIMGVAMLFVLAFQLLNNIVDPEKAASGEASTQKIVTNIITSLLLLVLLPTIFKYLYRVQRVILEENIIAKIILGTSETEIEGGKKDLNSVGRELVVQIFPSFIYPYSYVGSSSGLQCESIAEKRLASSYCDAYNDFIEPTSMYYGNISRFNEIDVKNELDRNKVIYKWGISTISGGFLVYMFIIFCIDMGIRVAKLAYFQLIAPIPIVLRIVPNQSKTFDNWLKSLSNTYLDVFTRLLVIYFGIFMIREIPTALQIIWQVGDQENITWFVKSLTQVALVFGVLTFMKEAPKLFSEMLGLDSSSLSLGLKDRIRNVPFAGKAVLGATNRIRGAVSGGAGRAWSALLNGENVGAAFLRGGVLGGATGGAQFKNQLNEEYRATTGDLSGNGSIFMRGGSVMTRIKSGVSHLQKDSYERTLNRKEEKIIPKLGTRYGVNEQEMRDRYVTRQAGNEPENFHNTYGNAYGEKDASVYKNLLSAADQASYDTLSTKSATTTAEDVELAELNKKMKDAYEKREHELVTEQRTNREKAERDYKVHRDNFDNKSKTVAERDAAREFMEEQLGHDEQQIKNYRAYRKKADRITVLNDKRRAASAKKDAQSDARKMMETIYGKNGGPTTPPAGGTDKK